MPVVVTNNTGKDYILPNRLLIPDGESVVLSDEELQWIPLEKRDAALLAVTALAGVTNVSLPTLATRVDDVGGGVAYVGKSEPGTATSAAAWQVQRVTETGADIVIEYANGSPAFNAAWDGRASLPYN